jgi:type I restriction enzyme R subunit
MTPEQLARQKIDAQLDACGWLVQDYKATDFSTGHDIAVCEASVGIGSSSYLFLVDRKPVVVVKAFAGTSFDMMSRNSD